MAFRRRLAGAAVAVVAGVLAGLGSPAFAADSAESAKSAAPPGDADADAAAAQASAARAQALDAVYGYKGWNVPFPSYADTLTQDDGHWRSRLAEQGLGFQMQISPIFQANVLDTPRKVPSSGYLPCGANSLKYNCAGGRSYFGQRPDAYFSGVAFLTYDMSRHGVPDGQIAVGAHFGLTTDPNFSPNALRIQNLSWYQTLLDKKVEIKLGYFPTMPEFAGTTVGGLVTSPFGPTASVPVVLGMSSNNTGTPNFRATWRVTDSFYAQTGIQRSLPVNGPTGNPIYDEVRANRSGIAFSSSVPGTRVLYSNELGYKRPAAPGRAFTWLRAGALYNSSDFADFSRALQQSGATRRGSHGFYALADYQLTQPASESPYTAYRGMYVGTSFMYGDPRTSAFTRYYEARAYWYGPFAARPTDFLSVVYSHNQASRHARRVIDAYSAYTNLSAIDATNSITASYTARLRPGLYSTFGLGYTDKPSLQRFKGEGSSLNLLLSLYLII
ncbi:MAG: carbohydrate porin [Comamonas sp.]